VTAKIKLFTPRESAQVLGISYPTLKQRIYKRKIRTVKTAGGHHRIPEKEIDRFLYQATERGDVAERRTISLDLSPPTLSVKCASKRAKPLLL
jgi:excisionase family DNA binding protein